MKKESISFPLRSPWILGQLAIWGTLLVGSLIIALLLRFTSFDASYIPFTTFLIHSISLFGGGFVAGKRAKKKGWYYGGWHGFLYTLLLILINFLAFDQMIKVSPILLAIFAFGLSSIGGIFGEYTTKKT